jgi:dipeptidyl aminopeptidase/acylaminoacyl peptidase
MIKISIVFLTLFSFLCGWLVRSLLTEEDIPNVLENVGIVEENFERYSIENLSKTDIESGKIIVLQVLNEEEDFNEHLFEFEFKPDPSKDEQKKTTGQINLPTQSSELNPNSLPIIVMLRGYINQETYQTGDGTRNASRIFAENGYITIAPDFMGYGGSSEEAGNIFETRFQTYVTVLSLIKSLDQIKEWNEKDILIWGHSNGGHIALAVLTITGKNYPTTLWAPVTKPFPYSVLYYTDQSVDGGKLIRKELAEFENDNDTDKFSFTNYLDKINSPIQFQQGEADDAVPVSWSNSLVSHSKGLEKEITYITYPDTDHNMRPSWDEAIAKDLEFYRKHLK